MWQRGREEWIAVALEAYEAPLLRYTRRLLHGDQDAARDVVQDAFLQLCKQQPAKMRGRVKEWLYVVCRNRCIDLLRKSGREHLVEQDYLEQQGAPDWQPAAGVLAEERRAWLDEQLASLPPRDREVLQLKFQDELSYQAISDVTGLSVSHVGVILHNCLKRLRNKLSAESGQVL